MLFWMLVCVNVVVGALCLASCGGLVGLLVVFGGCARVVGWCCCWLVCSLVVDGCYCGLLLLGSFAASCCSFGEWRWLRMRRQSIGMEG